jgi:glycosyltransferase 2 family protein
LLSGVRGKLESGPRGKRMLKVAAWFAGIAVVLVVLDLLGVSVLGWIRDLFKDIGKMSVGALIGGLALETVQTLFAALAWLTILRAAFPNPRIQFRTVFAAYAASVALNGFLPANLGTLVMLVMLLGAIAAASFAALVSGFVVQKIPFSVMNIAVYLYLFLTVRGSFSIKLGGVAKHPALTVLIAVGAILLLVMLARILWSRTEKLRGQLKEGGTVLGQPKRFALGVVLPELISYGARFGVIAVFMAGFSIPVTFHTVVSVSASNSVSNGVSLTPGGVGVNQAMNAAALRSVTSASNATNYSLTQQLVTTAWNVLLAVGLVAWAFGWSGGKEVLSSSYKDARVRSRELKEAKRERRETKRERYRDARAAKREEHRRQRPGKRLRRPELRRPKREGSDSERKHEGS